MTELQRDEPGTNGVLRILRDWVADAIVAIDRKNLTAANVHDARKRLKKSRAALRLLRKAIGDTDYEHENAVLRDIARPLGLARDSAVLLTTLENLVDADSPGAPALDAFLRILRKERTDARRSLTAALLAKQRKAMRDLAKRSGQWTLSTDPPGEDWISIGAGLKRSYRSGKKKMKAADRGRATDDLHAWRKQVKYFWHQLQIVQPAWPGVLGELARQAHKLADHLGDDHDLAVLRDKALAHTDAFDAADLEQLLESIDRRRARLQAKAFALGEKVYEEKPRQFQRRIETYWRSWQGQHAERSA